MNRFAGIARVMGTKTGMAACVVVGGALTAFGQGECSGTQALIGAGMGMGILFQRLATEKLMTFVKSKVQ